MHTLPLIFFSLLEEFGGEFSEDLKKYREDFKNEINVLKLN